LKRFVNIALFLCLVLIIAGCALPPSFPFKSIEPVTTTTIEIFGREISGIPESNPSSTITETPIPSDTPSPTPTQIVFEFGKELTIKYLRELEINGSEIIFHERLSAGYNYARHLVSYTSEGNQIFGVLTIPFAEPPVGGFKAIVFNHGYIPPDVYQSTERYQAYVDYLARNDFVVFKIDYRGRWRSVSVVIDPIGQKIFIAVHRASPDHTRLDIWFYQHSSQHQVAGHAVAPHANALRIDIVLGLQALQGCDCINSVARRKVRSRGVSP